jgi:addiction module HigA family antidote
VTSRLARLLGREFDTGANFWENLQRMHDLASMDQAGRPLARLRMITRRLVPHPGAILWFEFMAPLKLSRRRLARRIRVPVWIIRDVVDGTASVSPGLATLLAKEFKVPAKFWKELQAHHDLSKGFQLTARPRT